VDLEGLVGTLGSRNNGGVADQGVVDTRVRDKVGLELVQVDVQGTIETQGSGDGANDLGDQSVQVLVVGTGNVQVALADVIDSLVVNQECAVGVLDGAVGGQDSVVGLDNGGRDTGSRVDGELELALLAVLGGEALEEQGAESRTGTTTEGVEDQEALQGVAVVGDTSDAVDNAVDHLLADGVVATGVVVGSILLAADQQLGVEERAVVTGADLVNGRGVQVDEDGAGHVFAATGLGEEGLERAYLGALLRIGVGTTIMSEAVLEEVPGGLSVSREAPGTMLGDEGSGEVTYSSQALLPSWVPAWPR
jgi:hypothetical protein